MLVPDNLDAESELLLRAAKLDLQEGESEHLRSLMLEIKRWDRVWSFAMSHGTGILIEKHVRTLCPELLANQYVTQLTQARAKCALQNSRLAKLLAELVRDFEALGVPIISVKGPTLALQAYGDISLRRFSDLDIFVAPEAFPAVHRYLVQAGYEVGPEKHMDIVESFMFTKTFLKLTHEQSYWRPDQSQFPIAVDVHWHLEPPNTISLDLDTIMKSCVSLEIAGKSVRALNPELLFMVLCLHGLRHQFREMRWVVDIYQLIVRNPEINWEHVYDFARRHQLARRIDFALLMTSAIANIEHPFVAGRIESASRDTKLRTWAERIVRGWLDHALIIEDNFRSYWKAQILTFDSPGRRARFMASELFDPTMPTYLEMPLPDKFFPLYKIIRPALLIRDFAAARLLGKNAPGHS